MLLTRVWHASEPTPTIEDIFSSSLTTIFTDDTHLSHGIPGQEVIYVSPQFGEIKLAIPVHPDVEEGRKLFAHYLWNSGIIAADAIESASSDLHTQQGRLVDPQELKEGRVRWDPKYWDVRGQDVLELGSGTALPSIIAALSSARSVTTTDHPSSPALVNDTISRNLSQNLGLVQNTRSITLTHPSSQSDSLSASPESFSNSSNFARTSAHVQIHGLSWGESFTSPSTYGKLSDPQPARHSFDKLIIADCLWMRSQHGNLVKTIDMWLKKPAVQTQLSTDKQVPDDIESQAQRPACALIVAGFHTGRSVVARFFKLATGSTTGNAEEVCSSSSNEDKDDDSDDDEEEETKLVRGIFTAADIFEIDVDCNTRPWVPIRAGEDKEKVKKWSLCAVLVRKSSPTERLV